MKHSNSNNTNANNESEYNSWKWRAMYFRRLVFLLLSNIFLIISWIYLYRDFYTDNDNNYTNTSTDESEIHIHVKRKPYDAWSNIYPIIPGFIFFHTVYSYQSFVRCLVPMFSFGKANRKWSFVLLNIIVMATVISSTHQASGSGYVMGFMVTLVLLLTHHLGFSDAVTVGVYCLYLVLGIYISIALVS